MSAQIRRSVGRKKKPFQAAIRAARELVGPIIAMTITLAAVYAPIGIQGGLTGALFREFAFTLAGAVIVSGVVALTLSPMMGSKLLRAGDTERGFAGWINRKGVYFPRAKPGFTADGPVTLKQARYARAAAPLDAECACYACRGFSRAYLHHLDRCGEMLAPMLTSIHNLHFYLKLMADLREAIARDDLEGFARRFGAAEQQLDGASV